jgi:hypothetical protein
VVSGSPCLTETKKRRLFRHLSDNFVNEILTRTQKSIDTPAFGSAVGAWNRKALQIPVKV